MKLVHREETFNDLAVRELAVAKAQCMCRLQFGRCELVECYNCSIGQNYLTTYNMLNTYDKTRMNNYVQQAYMKESACPEKWRSLSGNMRGLFNMLLIMFFGILLLFGIIMLSVSILPGDKPITIKADTSMEIIQTLHQSQSYVYDMNTDGKINCIDYAVMFKVMWDRNYDPTRCIIVRNRNVLTGFHHLFVCIDNYIYVETWCSNVYDYLMENNWDARYNPKFNIKTETNKWLEVCIE